MYLPYGHSENLADQDRSVELGKTLDPHSAERSEHHRDIIRRFGRFPHRNAILGRTSRPEEERYLAEGGYEWVAERFFSRARASHFLLEYDTPRAGDFAPLRLVPAGKGVVLGLVSSKTPVLETAKALCRRLEEAARYIDLDRLAVSPQCGFASTAAGNPLSEADQRAKLALVVDTARAVWGEP